MSSLRDLSDVISKKEDETGSDVKLRSWHIEITFQYDIFCSLKQR